MDRLAEKAIGILNECCEDAPETGCGLIDFDDYGQIMNALEKLRAYEDAEEQGRLMRLPCAVGDIVYQTDSVRVYESEVKRILLIFDTDKGVQFDERAIGESVFLTPIEME